MEHSANQSQYNSHRRDRVPVRYPTFIERAQDEPNTMFADDLRFVSRIAKSLGEDDCLALAVGGYPRDVVMADVHGNALDTKDIDIEVYGASFPQLVSTLHRFGRVDMVGQNFGVAKVTSPVTGSIMDFSIPREDSKVDKGHKGFQVTGNPNMSIEDAARRRDLTINALAINPLTGVLHDAYNGVRDIQGRVLRATDMQLFADDPLRALRIMQFAGRFAFSVDPATADLCRSLDLSELPSERIGEEWIKLMTKSPKPSIGLQVAQDIGVLDQLHPELAVLHTIEQEPEWHPEGNVWEHSKLAADAASTVVCQEGLSGDDALVVLFGALCHDLGKTATTMLREKQGRMRITAHGHEAAGVEPTKQFLKTLNMKHAVIDKILPIVRHHLYHVHVPNPTDKQLHTLARHLEPASIRLWDLVSRCDANGRGGAFVPYTASHALAEHSLQLHVAEKPASPLVQGRHLIQLGLKPGPAFGPALKFLYDAQLGGAFASPEEGIAYYRAHYTANQ